MKLHVLDAAHLPAQCVELEREWGAEVFEDEAKEHESKVAVDRLRSRWIYEGGRADRVFKRGASLVLFEERSVRGQPTAVGGQGADRHRRYAIVVTPERHACRDGIVEA